MTYHTKPAPRLSGSIWILVSVFSLFLITACGGGGLKLDANLNINDNRLAVICGADPFKEECIKNYAAGRTEVIAACVKDATTTPDLCETATTFVCEGDTANPFAPLCQTDANSDTYESDRTNTISTCIDPSGDLTSRFCLNAIEVTCADEAERTANTDLCAGFEADQDIVDTCDSNIFNTSCDNNPIYKAQRNAFCGTPANAADNRCTAVISSACTYDANDASNKGNPFDAVCPDATYTTSRNDIITACTANLSGRLCTNATSFICATNPFHALCYDSSATAFETARQTAVTNCGDGTTTITEQICADAAQLACDGEGADIFNTLCGAYSGQPTQTTACGDNDDATRCYLQDQIDRCADGREVARCELVGTGDISTCAADPFAAACVVAASPFAAYLAGAQGARYDYCREAGVSATDPICASYRACQTALDGGTDVPAGCGINFDATLLMTCTANPFDSQCASDTYNDNKVAFCSINTPASGGDPAVNNLFNPNCTADYQDTMKRNDFCTADPFHASCNANPAYAGLRDTNCKGAASARHASCVTSAIYANTPTGPSALAGSLKYADSFLAVTITQDNAIAPALGDLFTAEVTETVPVPDDAPEDAQPTTRIVSEEISIASEDIGPRVVGRRGGAGTTASPNDNDDGWIFFTLTRPRLPGDTDSLASVRTSRHTAILPTTNLGAPLRAAPTTAVWPGHFRTTATVDPTAVDFYIDYGLRRVGFNSPTRVGIGNHLDTGKQHDEDRPLAARSNKIRIDVRWYESGALYGFIEINDDDLEIRDSLIVNGLIGQEGLVAVAHSNANKGGAGGFTASNPDHPDYVPAVVAADASDEETDTDSNSNLVNYEDWTESGARPKRDRSGPRQSEILQTTTFTDNKRGLLGLVNGANAQIVDFHSTTHFRSPLLRGEAKNGFALRGESDNFYAGVLHTADLGAPINVAGLIAQNIPSAIWRGYLVAADGDATTSKQFNLTVTFSTSHEGQAGTLTGDVHNDINVGDRSGLLYSIEARFNARGVISGNISRSLEVNTVQKTFITPLSGLIGLKGAIGVFANNEENKFAGGFVAVPNQPRNANYATWAGSVPLTAGGLRDHPEGFNHWLTGGTGAGRIHGLSATGIAPGSVQNLDRVAGALNLANATWKRVSLGGSVNNGVGFYTGTLNRARFFYSGVTATTNLGRPLTQAGNASTLKWVGHLVARQHINGGIHHRSGDIELTIRFDATKVGGKITGALVPNNLTSIGYRYNIDADFNGDGFVNGNVTTISGDNSQFRETGYVTGLIGAYGAIGSFVAPNFSGGFVAVPHKPDFSGRATTYHDWVHFAGQRFGALRDKPYNEAGQRNAFLHTSPADGNNIPWGDIGQDGSREHTGRGAFGVGAAFAQAGLKAPAGLRGGFSWLAGFWDRQDAVAESSNTLNRGYHAGLFQDINVGLPLGPLNHYGASASSTATWRGWFYAHQNKTFAASVNTSVPIRLLVNYGARYISYSYDTTYGNLIGGIYSITALDGGSTVPFDERGVITGRIEHKDANVPDGNITGLIGQQGLVAVFVSDPHTGTKPHYGYAGGFVACPLLTKSYDSNCIK